MKSFIVSLLMLVGLSLNAQQIATATGSATNNSVLTYSQVPAKITSITFVNAGVANTNVALFDTPYTSALVWTNSAVISNITAAVNTSETTSTYTDILGRTVTQRWPAGTLVSYTTNVASTTNYYYPTVGRWTIPAASSMTVSYVDNPIYVNRGLVMTNVISSQLSVTVQYEPLR